MRNHDNEYLNYKAQIVDIFFVPVWLYKMYVEPKSLIYIRVMAIQERNKEF